MQNPYCEGHNRGQGGRARAEKNKEQTHFGKQNMGPERAEKESQIEEGTDAIDETARNKQDTKSAEMTAIGMYSRDGAPGGHAEEPTVTASSSSAFVSPRGAENNDWAQLGEPFTGRSSIFDIIIF